MQSLCRFAGQAFAVALILMAALCAWTSWRGLAQKHTVDIHALGFCTIISTYDGKILVFAAAKPNRDFNINYRNDESGPMNMHGDDTSRATSTFGITPISTVLWKPLRPKTIRQDLNYLGIGVYRGAGIRLPHWLAAGILMAFAWMLWFCTRFSLLNVLTFVGYICVLLATTDTARQTSSHSNSVAIGTRAKRSLASPLLRSIPAQTNRPR
jgi:hypothetical protein